ncbi:YaaL family protein [Petralouisia muris]|jgi:hypothetical protein|uniref:YaaL family protein n=1 Tax=Petralouisia muris TaxID=3032872 RepID=UPI002ED46CDF
MFLISKKQTAHATAYSSLLDDLEKAQYDLALAYNRFENAMDPDLIDCCIYQVKALQMRYKFLLTKAKQFDEEDSYAKNPLELSEP